ncbi:AAA family ATPase [Pseudomonas umsongensis]|uniref:AAA family ATPase n=1 Tax=Pseudomonas umsongensis TaxID=198618 RepID=UPI00039E1797|nr:AAA family ATPase [Pseudomonas umsongensis]
MSDTAFIKSFVVNDIRNVKPVSVSLGENKTHLIITGRNGSGKTSILKAIQEELSIIKSTNGKIHTFRDARRNAEKAYLESPVASNLTQLNTFKSYQDAKVSLSLAGSHGFIEEQEICIFFSANRALDPSIPSSITAPSLPLMAGNVPVVNTMILQYLVNMKAQRAFARDDSDDDSVRIIDTWFESFEEALRDAFENRNISLEFDRQALSFSVVDGDKKYSLNTLSSGQSAILSIYAELLLRVEAAAQGNKNISGVILIDEPENHLHASLQKKILAFLVKAFPQFQFIVTTHSPFIISSLQNTKILNLEDGNVYEDFSSFSYEAILEEYMQVDKYSVDVKRQVEDIKKFLTVGDASEAQSLLDDLLQKLKMSEFSVHASAELALELNSIKLALKNIE